VKRNFPWSALGLGLLLAFLLVSTGALGPESGRALPLLTLLIISEFGGILSLIGAGMALQSLVRERGGLAMLCAALGCALLAGGFLWLGLQLWPGGVSS
jgi:hypothetical protein